MASNLDYLRSDLVPLEEKVLAYLEAEEDLRKATIENTNLHAPSAAPEESTLFYQRPATGSFDQGQEEVEQRRENMRADLALLRDDIIAMLPVRDEFIKVNLGYGPSRVGAFRTAASSPENPTYELRIVH